MTIPNGAVMYKTHEHFIGQKVLFSMLPASQPRAFDTDTTTVGIIIATRASERGYARCPRDLDLFKIGMFTDETDTMISVSISWIHKSEILEILDENLHNGQDMIQDYFLRYMDSPHTMQRVKLDNEAD